MAPNRRLQILIFAVPVVYVLIVAGLTVWVHLQRNADRAAWRALSELGARAVGETPANLSPLETACAGRLVAAPPGALIGWSAPTKLEARVAAPGDGFGGGLVRPQADRFSGFVHGRWETIDPADDYYPQTGGLHWMLLFEPGEWSKTLRMSTEHDVKRDEARWLLASRVLDMTAPQFVDPTRYDAGRAQIHAALLSIEDGHVICEGLVDTSAPDSIVSRSWHSLSAGSMAPDALANAFVRRMRDAPMVALCEQVSDQLCKTVANRNL